jgi:chromosome partitioning protein
VLTTEKAKMAAPARSLSHPTVIAIANQKGGCGKTTTTLSLGAALAERDRRVLLIDLDPQNALTRGVGLDPGHLISTTRDVLYGGRSILETAVPGQHPKVLVVPANLRMVRADLELSAMRGGDVRLREALQPVHDVDYVLIDCPPSLAALTGNALAAAQFLIVPVDSEPWALDTIDQLFEQADEIRRYVNRDLRLLGVVLTRYRTRSAASQQVAEMVRARWRDDVFATAIRDSTKAIEAAIASCDIIQWAPKSPIAQDYRALAEEVEARVHAR